MQSAFEPSDDDRRIQGLLATEDGMDVAFIRYGGPGLRSSATVWFARRRPVAPEPLTAAIDLIQGLWELDPDNARTHVRRRILTSYSPSDMERDFVKVSAKQIWGPIEGDDSPLDDRDHLIDVGPLAARARQRALDDVDTLAGPDPNIQSANQWAEHAKHLASTVDRYGPRHSSAQPVGCVLLDDQLRFLHQARNTNSKHRTLHAEANLVQTWFSLRATTFPKSCTVITTLQPCRMCASLLRNACEDPDSLSVIYLDEDRGRMARNTILSVHDQEISLSDFLAMT